ncbi:hypothetical protein HDU67_003346, partial [Dinochytrium kinnereticum]
MEEMKKKDDADDDKRLAKTRDAKSRLNAELDVLTRDLDRPNLKVSQRNSIRDRIKRSTSRIAMLKHEEDQILDRIKKRQDQATRRRFWSSEGGGPTNPATHHPKRATPRRSAGPVTILPSLPDIIEPAALGEMEPEGGGAGDETERDFLIRTGKITPFASVAGLERGVAGEGVERLAVATALVSRDGAGDRSIADLTEENRKAERRLLSRDGVEGPPRRRLRRMNEPERDRGRMKRKRGSRGDGHDDDDEEEDDGDHESDADYVPSGSDAEEEVDGEVDVGGEGEEDEEDEGSFVKTEKVKKDDGDELFYERRLRKWLRLRRLQRLKNTLPEGEEFDSEDEGIVKSLYEDPHLEPLQPCPGDAHFEGGLTGLGKTVQIIAFLSSLSRSNLLTAPILIVCPATVLRQWCNEFHAWWPYFRVAILHSSGSGLGSSVNLGEEEEDDDPEFEEVESRKQRKRRRGGESEEERVGRGMGRGRGVGGKKKGRKVDLKGRKPSAKTARQVGNLVRRIVEKGHIVLTTYEGLRVHQKSLLPVQWAYCVLDEGHKIRNPDADITLACKRVKTPNRIILSGTPIQNNLKELWSLYDFVYPGRLGTLPVFATQFEVPIRLGAYSNASLLQVQTAQRCASVLRKLISPYLLRRMKGDVASDLPRKSEQVLFCRLSEGQRVLYEGFLGSRECRLVLEGRRNALAGIDVLRKICNHPDLVPDFGNPERSGKLQVVRALLASWTHQGHRTLVFCQTRQMLDIVERMVA